MFVCVCVERHLIPFWFLPLSLPLLPTTTAAAGELIGTGCRAVAEVLLFLVCRSFGLKSCRGQMRAHADEKKGGPDDDQTDVAGNAE